VKSKSTYLPILLFACVALGIFVGSLLNFPTKNPQQAKLNKLISFINQEYVDEVNIDSIVDLTVNSILEKLDPHSVYLPPSEQTAEAEYMKGDFVGIGVNFYMYKDTVTVVSPLENGPAQKAGIQAGDRILYADKSKLFGRKLPSDSLYAKLKGEAGSKVNITVFRKSNNKTLKFTLTRSSIPIKSVDIAMMLNASTGYIKINRFAETTFTEFKKGLDHLISQKATTLVLDLRQNGGGYMEEAIKIADEFLRENELIVMTKNKKGATTRTVATEEGSFEKGKLYILIDENSASASEIIAGAIQDNDRGTIIGRRSFGKGLVQREMDFNDGSAVRLTTARYYTPSGRSIQKPYKKGEGEAYLQEYENRYENGELLEKDKIKIADSLKFKTKKGRIVYGGGGIHPDIFVPLEVKKGEESVAYILSTGVVGHFVFEQLDKKRSYYQSLDYPRFTQEIKGKNFTTAFEKYLSKIGFEQNLENNKKLVNKYILAEFAQQLFGEKEYYEILLKEDTMLSKVK
jgi:carboxyl-terminal processing protease